MRILVTGATGFVGVERTWPDVEQVTGHPPRTFAQWARDHVADFRRTENAEPENAEPGNAEPRER